MLIEDFFNPNPYGIEVRLNPTAGRREWVVTKAPELPTGIGIIAGDAFHNLRSALDHLVYQLVLANGGEPNTMRTEFQVWGSEHGFKSSRPGNTKGMSDEALELYYELKPYRGGSEFLWPLHRLDIVDKHRLMLAVASGYQSFLPPNMVKQMLLERAEAENDLALKKEAEEMPDHSDFGIRPATPIKVEVGAVLFSAPLEAETHASTAFTFAASLYDSEVPDGAPVQDVLKTFAERTSGVLDLFAPLVDCADSP